MNKHRILVFDVETTGLLPKKGPSAMRLDPTVPKEPSKGPSATRVTSEGRLEPNPFGIDLNPYIIQFSFILYNTLNRTIERKHDFYINPPIDISEKITEITGITKETCVQKGVPLILALDCFYNCYMMSGRVIAHNLAFDTEMVKIEIERNREEIEQLAHYCLNIFDATFEKTHGIDQFCTMRYGTNICNIMVLRNVRSAPKDKKEIKEIKEIKEPTEIKEIKEPTEIKEIKEPTEIKETTEIKEIKEIKETTEIKEIKEPTYYKKWPTLLEFHKHLFNTIPDNLHNSIVDVLVCLRCYLKSYRKIEIDEETFAHITKLCIYDL